MASHWITAATQGLLLSFALILAIGAQNAFVLRQGLRNEHVGLVVAICALADALLIATGVFGASWFAHRMPWLAPVLTGLGAVFLLSYGGMALRRAWFSSQGLVTTSTAAATRGRVMTQALGFTLLNPHVYLDTVLLAGSVGAQQPSAALRGAFVLGASVASATWFIGLGLGARSLAPWLARPIVWRSIDAMMGILLIALGLSLLRRWI